MEPLGVVAAGCGPGQEATLRRTAPLAPEADKQRDVVTASGSR